MNLMRAWITLSWLSFRRLLWSAGTLMVLFPLLGCLLLVWGQQRFWRGDPAFATERFMDFMVLGFASFVLPIVALAFGATSVGGDREDKTLLFLLVRPIPRSLVLCAKFAATLPLALGLTFGSFYAYCLLAGPAGELARQTFMPALFSMTLAYLAMFHLFAVAFRHATILALVYTVFVEALLGGLPGIIKRVAINYYGRSLMYNAAEFEGLSRPTWFEPISSATANWALLGLAAGAFGLALLIFQWREYRDLS